MAPIIDYAAMRQTEPLQLQHPVMHGATGRAIQAPQEACVCILDAIFHKGNRAKAVVGSWMTRRQFSLDPDSGECRRLRHSP
jgi:hypothetical protein